MRGPGRHVQSARRTLHATADAAANLPFAMVEYDSYEPYDRRIQEREMTKEDGERQRIQSVVVGSRILEALAYRNGAMSLTEIAKAAEMAPAKAHRYLVGFMTAGLIVQNEVNGHYDLGPLALDLGLAAIRRLDVVEVAYPMMVAMRDETNETMSLAVWGNLGPTLVRWIPSNAPVSITINVGSVLPLLTSSNGRIFAAYLPKEKIAPLIEAELRREGPALKAAGLNSRKEINEVLQSVRENSMAAGVGLVVPAIASLSAPVFDRTGAVVAALTVVGITGMMPTDFDSPIAETLRNTARLLSGKLGFKDGDTA